MGPHEMLGHFNHWWCHHGSVVFLTFLPCCAVVSSSDRAAPKLGGYRGVGEPRSPKVTAFRMLKRSDDHSEHENYFLAQASKLAARPIAVLPPRLQP